MTSGRARGMERKAARGHVCGGRTFGYNNLVITDEAGRRSHVVRRINEAEATVIRRLFDLYTSGLGYQAIALRLNGEGALAPKPKRATLPQGWAPSRDATVTYARASTVSRTPQQ